MDIKRNNNRHKTNFIPLSTIPYTRPFKTSILSPCSCSSTYVKTYVKANQVLTGISKKSKISQTLGYVKGGKLNYGNFYLGQPLNINYLGRTEGMSGGSGSPPTNKF
jgi:hypothetical protein